MQEHTMSLESERVAVDLRVNGESRVVDVEPRDLLVHVLRDRLELTGTHIGCETSSCGACTVLIDGQSAKSCTVLAVQAAGHEVTTIEGLAGDGSGLHPVQEAFRQHHALQCGFCTPGMVMAAVSLIAEGRACDEASVRAGLKGNLCRCTGYHNIVRAVLAAAEDAPAATAAGAGAAVGTVTSGSHCR
jgi:aerobic carbon-monoxide dehydrogenase small subunit